MNGETSRRSAQRRVSQSKRSSLFRAAVLAALALSPAVKADLIWDADGTTPANGGAGNWDTVQSLWTPDETNYQTWATDLAVFKGTGATVTLIEPITANGLRFESNSFTIAGSAVNTLTLGGAATLEVTNVANTATISAPLLGTGFTKDGPGRLNLTGDNSGVTGAVNITGGILGINASAALGDGSASNGVTLTNGGRLLGTAALDLGAARTIAVSTGGGALGSSSGVMTVSGSIVGSTSLSINGAGTVDLTGDNSGFSGAISIDSLAGAGANTRLRLTNLNAVTSNTITINGGAAAAGGTGNVLELNNVSVSSSVSLVMSGDGANNFRTGLVAETGSTSSWNGSILLTGGAGTLNQMYANGTANLTIAGNITGPSFLGTLFLRGSAGGAAGGTITGTINIPTGTLSKTEGGTWTIQSPSQVIAAAVQVADGTLKSGATNIFPTTLAITMGQNSGTSGIWDMNGWNQTLIGIQSAAGTTGTNRIVNSQAFNATLTLDVPAATTYTYNQVIGNTAQNDITLIKDGLGTQVLGGASTYTGGTTVNSGMIRITNPGALGTGDAVFNVNTTLESATTGTVTSNIVLAGGLWRHVQSGQIGAFATGKALKITENSTVDVVVPLSAGKILLNANQLEIGFGKKLTKMGAGVLQLTGANSSISGDLQIDGGFIEFQNADALGFSAMINPIVINNGGEFLSTAVPVRHNFTLNTGATLSANSTGAADYQGTIDIATGQTATALGRKFQDNTPSQLKISGPLTGGGTLRVSGVPTTNNSKSSVLLTNANTGFTGTLMPVRNGLATVVVGSGTHTLGGASVVLNNGTLGITPEVTGPGGSAGLRGLWQTNATQITNGVIGGYDFNLFSGTTSVTATATSADTTLNFPNLQTAGKPAGITSNNNMGVLWTGYLTINSGGVYSFNIPADDGVQLWVGGQPVMSDDVSGGPRALTGTMNLNAGTYPVAIRYGQGTGGTSLVFNYTGPDTGGVSALVGSVANTLTNNSSAILGTSTINRDILVQAMSASGIDLIATTATMSDGFSAGNNGKLTFGTNSQLTLTGETSFETLTMDASSTFTLNGRNTIVTGVPQIPGNITGSSSGADLIINTNVVEGTAGSTLVKGGTRKLILSGASNQNQWTGGTIIIGGAIETANELPGDVFVTSWIGSHQAFLRNTGANIIKDTATVTIGGVSGLGGGNWDLNNNNETINKLVILNNQGSTQAQITTGGGGTLTVLSDILARGSSTGGSQIAGNLNLGGNRTIETWAAGATTISAFISGGNLTKTGLGAVSLTGANTSWNDNIIVNNGKLLVGNADALGTTTGTTVVNSGGNIEFTNLAAGFMTEAITINGHGPRVPVTVAEGGGPMRNGALSGTGFTLANSVSAPIILGSDSSIGVSGDGTATTAPDHLLTLSGVISDGGMGYSLRKTLGTNAIVGTSATSGGGGILKLTNANTYTGKTIIEAGELVLANPSGQAIQSTMVQIGTGARNGATLTLGASEQMLSSVVLDFRGQALDARDAKFQLNGFTQTVAGFLNTVDNSPIIQNHENAAAGTVGTLIVDNPADTLYAGYMRSQNQTLALTKRGAGTLTLAGIGLAGSQIIHTGTTTIEQGKLSLFDNTANFASPITLSSNVNGTGSLEINTRFGRTTPFTAAINDTATSAGFTKIGGGTMTMVTATSNVLGSARVNEGTLALLAATGNLNPLPGTPVVVEPGAALALQGVTAVNISFNNNVTLKGLTPGGALAGATVGGTPTNNLTGTLTLQGEGMKNISTGWNDKTFIVSGQITGDGGLQLDKLLYTQNQPIFSITNTTNNYAGGTNINAGSVYFADGALPNTGNLKFGGTFGGGTLMISTNAALGILPANFTRNIGTAAGEMSITGDGGGFSVNGTAGTPVNLTFGGGTPQTVQWGTAAFEANASFIFNTANNLSAAGTTTNVNTELNLTNDIVLNSAGVRRVIVGDGSGTTDWVRFSGQLSGDGSLLKEGNGILYLSGGTGNSYAGLTNVSGGTLILNKTSGNAIPGDVQISSNQGGTRRVVYLNNDEQIADGATVSFIGSSNNNGDLRLLGFDETVGALQDRSGGGVIETVEAETTTTLPNANAAGSILTVNGPGDSFYNGFIRNRGGGTYAGTLSLVKNGAGTLTLSAGQQSGTTNQIYTGTTTVNAGTLRLVNTESFNSPISLVNPGTTLEFAPTIARTHTYGFLGGTNPTNLITGSGDVVKNGVGTVVLNTANSYSGTTTVNAGVLQVTSTQAGSHTGAYTVNSGGTLLVGNGTTAGELTNNNAITLNGTGIVAFNRNNAMTYAGVINGTGSVENRAAGVILLSGANAYSGTTTSSAGNLVLAGTNISGAGLLARTGGTVTLDFGQPNSAASNLVASGAPVTLTGGTLSIAGGAVANAQTLGAVALNAGVSNINLTPGGVSLAATFGAFSAQPGASVNIGIPAGVTATTSTTPVGGILGGYATSNTGSTFVAVDGGGNMTPLVSGSVDTYGAGINTDVVAGGAGASTNSIRFNNPAAATVTMTGSNAIDSGGILVTSNVGNNAVSITGGSISGGPGTGLFVLQNNTANSLTIASDIVDNGGASALTKAGAGTLNLSGNSAYSGGTIVSQGTLINTGTLGSGQATVASGATLQLSTSATVGAAPPAILNRGNLTVSNGGVQTISSLINVAPNFNYTVNGVANSTSYQTGVISKFGAGQLILAGPIATSQIHQRAGVTIFSTGANVFSNSYNSVGLSSGDVAEARFRGVARFTQTGDFNVADTGTASGLLTVQDGALLSIGNLFVGKGDTTVGRVNQTLGSVVNAGGNNDWRIGGMDTVGSAGAYGIYNLSGGTLQTARNFQIGARGRGVFNQTGGSVNITGATNVVGRYVGGLGLLNISNGTYTNTTTNRMIIGEAGTGTVNVSGTGQLLFTGATGGLGLGHNNGGAGIGVVNLLAGGLIQTPQVADQNTNAADGTSVFNFNGGTLRVTAASTVGATFMTGLTRAEVQSGGAQIDTNGIATTIAQALVAPSGLGLVNIGIGSGGTGYISEPIVQIIGGTGTGATARAIISGGSVTGFNIISPGSGYGASDVLTINVLGGGGSGFALDTFTPFALGAVATTGGLTKLNTGNLTLANTETYGGSTTVTGGTLVLDYAAATSPASNMIPATSPLVLNGGNLTITGKASTVNAQTFAGVTLNAPSIITGTIGTSGTVNMTLGAITRNPGGAVNFVLPGTGTIATSSTNTGTSILGGWSTVAGVNWATVSGGNIAAMTSYVNDTWAAANNTTVTTTGTRTSLTTNSIRWSQATPSTVTLSGTNTVTTGGILITTTNTAAATILTGGTLATGTNTDLVVNHFGTGAVRIDSVIAANGTGGLVKAGPGVLLLGGANTYSGNTVIGAGTVRLAVANAIPDGAGKGDMVIAAGASFDLNNLSDTINGLSGWGSVTTGVAGSPTLTVGGNNVSSTFSGTILNGSGTPILTKTGTGVLTLNNVAAGTYTGATNISAGAIRIATPQALANNTTINVNVANGLQFDTTVPVISGLGGNQAFALQTQASSPVPSAPVQLSVGNNNPNATYSGGLSGTGTLVKIGTGVQTLSGTNTNTGGMISTAGTLVLSGNNSGASGLLIASSGGVVQINAANSFLGAPSNKIQVAPGGAVSFFAGTGNAAQVPFGPISSGLNRIDPASLGLLTLQTDATLQAPITEDLDFSAAGPGGALNLGLGAVMNNNSTTGVGNAPVQYTGVITPNNGTFRVGGGGGRLILPNGATLAGPNSLITYGSGGGTNVGLSNTGFLYLTGAYSYTGSTTLNPGNNLVTTLANAGQASSIGAASADASNLVLNGSTLWYVGSGSTTDRLFTLMGNGNLDSSGTGPVNFTNTGAMGLMNTGTHALTLQGNNRGANTLAAAIGDAVNVAGASDSVGSAPTSVTKNGNGTWVLSGNNTFSGGVTINNGLLRFENANAIGANMLSGPASILVNAGGAVGFGPAFNGSLQATLNRVSPLSTGTIALTADTSENLNLDGGSAGANLPTATLGAQGNVTYTGTLTPFGSVYRLGGGGGVLNMPNGGLTGPRQVVISGGGPGAGFVNSPNLQGVVVLGGTSDYSGGTVLSPGSILSITDNRALGSGPLKFQGGTYRVSSNTNDITLASDGVSAREIRFGADASANAQTANIDVPTGIDVSFSKTLGPAATYGSNLGVQQLAKYGGGSLTLTNGINLNTSGGTTFTNNGTLTIERGTLSIAANPTYWNGLLSVGSNNGGVGTLKLVADNVFASGFGYGSGTIIDTYSGSKIDLNGKTDTIRLFRGMGTITNTGAPTANLTFGTNNENALFGGQFVGDFTLTRAGANAGNFGTGNNTGSLEIFQYLNYGFTGKLVANSGGFRMRADGSIGSPTEPFKADKITLNNNAILYNTGNPMAIGANHGITLGAGGGTLWAHGTQPMIVQAPITGSGMLSIADDPGPVMLASDSNDYTGGTTINSNTAGRGMLTIGAGGTTGSIPAGNIYFNSGAGMARLYFFKSTDLTVPNDIDGPGQILQIGAGTTTLTGNVTTNNGIHVAGGKLVADFTNPAKTPVSSGALLNLTAGTFEYKAPSGDNFLHLGATAVTVIANNMALPSSILVGAGTGDATLQSTYGGSGNQVLLLNSIARGTAGTTLNFVTSGGVNGTTNRIEIATLAPNTSLGAAFYFGPEFAVNCVGSFIRPMDYDLDVNTSPVNTITANRYNKFTTSQANLAAVAMTALHLNGATDVTMNAAAALTMNGNPAAILKTGGGMSIIGGGAGATVNNNGQELIIRTDSASDVVRLDIPLAGTGGLTKSGPGQLTFNAVNTFTGNIIQPQGTILVTGSASVGGTGGGEVRMATAAGQSATMTIDSATASITTGNGANALRVGEAGTAVFNQSAGTVNAANYLVIGESLGSTGTYEMTGGTMNVKTFNGTPPGGSPGLMVGRAGTGTLNISGSSIINIQNGGQLQLAPGTINPGQFQGLTANSGVPTGVGVVNQTGGQVNVATTNGTFQGNVYGMVVLGVDGTGTYNLDGGTLSTPFLGRGHGTGNFNLGSGTLRATAGTMNVDLPVNLTQTGANRGVVNTNGNDVAFTGGLTGTGGFVKDGAGTLTLQSNANYAGGTNITTGTVVGTGTSLGTGPVVVDAGGTLRVQGVQQGLLAKFYMANKTNVNPGVATGSADMSPEFASLEALNTFLAGKPLAAVESTTARGKISVNYLEPGGANQASALPPAIVALQGGDDPFIAHLSGKFNAPVAGDYTFQTRSDDGNVLWIDGQPVLDNNRSQGQVTRTGTINLTAGLHDITFGYYQGSGGGGFSVGVTLPDQGQSFTTGNELNMSNALLSYGTDTLTIASLSGAGAVDLSTGTLATGGDNSSTSYDGVMSGSGNLIKQGTGTMTMSNTATYTGATTVANGTLKVTGSVLTSSGVSVSAGAKYEVGSNQGVQSLTLAGASNAWTAKVDLKDNDLAVQNGDLPTVLNQIKQGRNGGAWNAANGITSSVAAGITGLAAIKNSDDGINALMASFNGVPVTKDAVLIKYTYNGDTDLSGRIDIDDYFRIDTNYALGTVNPTYRQGDFNYSGTITADDYFLIDAAFLGQGLPLSGGTPAPAAPSAAVPEPGALSLLALGAAALLGRRRRSR